MPTTVKALLLGALLCIVHSRTSAQGQQVVDRTELREKLVRAVGRNDNAAVLELGTLGDPTVIPLLKKLAAGPDTKFHSAAANARMALAKLGDRGEFKRIEAELQSDDPAITYEAVQKLRYVGSQDAIKVLIGLLDDMEWRVGKGSNFRGPNGELPQDAVIYPPMSYAAMQALAKIAPNPPVPPNAEPKVQHIQLWRKWWTEVGTKLGETRP